MKARKFAQQLARHLQHFVMWLASPIARIAEQRRRAKAMKRHGWDGKCSACNRWLHADECGTCVAETDWHWFYMCDCGAQLPFCVGIAPCPILNSPIRDGWPDWRKELEENPEARKAVETHNA